MGEICGLCMSEVILTISSSSDLTCTSRLCGRNKYHSECVDKYLTGLSNKGGGRIVHTYNKGYTCPKSNCKGIISNTSRTPIVTLKREEKKTTMINTTIKLIEENKKAKIERSLARIASKDVMSPKVQPKSKQKVLNKINIEIGSGVSARISASQPSGSIPGLELIEPTVVNKFIPNQSVKVVNKVIDEQWENLPTAWINEDSEQKKKQEKDILEIYQLKINERTRINMYPKKNQIPLPVAPPYQPLLQVAPKPYEPLLRCVPSLPPPRPPYQPLLRCAPSLPRPPYKPLSRCVPSPLPRPVYQPDNIIYNNVIYQNEIDQNEFVEELLRLLGIQ